MAEEQAISEVTEEVQEVVDTKTQEQEVEVQATGEEAQAEEVIDLTPEQRQRILDEAIADGTVVDYEKRFKPIYGALKQTERDLDAERTKASQETTPTQTTGTPRPNKDDFDDYDDYRDAVDDWRWEQREASKKEASAKASAAEKMNAWNNQMIEASAKDPQFQEKAYIPNDMVPLLEGSDKLADFAYYFGEHPEEARTIINLPRAQALRELGKVEVKMEMPRQRTTTKAPAATKAENGAAPVTKKLEDMEYEEYKAHRKAGGT